MTGTNLVRPGISTPFIRQLSPIPYLAQLRGTGDRPVHFGNGLGHYCRSLIELPGLGSPLPNPYLGYDSSVGLSPA
jgi:hypothetical protein